MRIRPMKYWDDLGLEDLDGDGFANPWMYGTWYIRIGTIEWCAVLFALDVNREWTFLEMFEVGYVPPGGNVGPDGRTGTDTSGCLKDHYFRGMDEDEAVAVVTNRALRVADFLLVGDDDIEFKLLRCFWGDKKCTDYMTKDAPFAYREDDSQQTVPILVNVIQCPDEVIERLQRKGRIRATY